CVLVALAFQLILSFGHLHLNFRDDGSRLAIFTLGAAQVPVSWPDAPAVPRQTGSVLDFCAICAVAQVTGSLLAPAVPALQLPIIEGGTRFEPSAGPILATTAHILSQARAPPLT